MRLVCRCLLENYPSRHVPRLYLQLLMYSVLICNAMYACNGVDYGRVKSLDKVFLRVH